jgi:protein-tyrosine kinase
MDKFEKALEKAKRQRDFGRTPRAAGLGHLAVADRSTDTPSLSGNSSKVIIDKKHLKRHRILAYHTRRPEADVFRILRTQVLQIMNQSGYKTLAITSPDYGDGKTTIALNLAISIVLDLKQTVLLVDLDLRKPNLHECLGLQPQFGLSDFLMQNTPLEKCILRLPFDRLSLLPAGQPLDHSSEVLGSPKMAALARELKARYPDRLIIYDMPPVLAQDDSIAFLPHVDAALVVVREGVTRTNDLTRCLEVLANATVIGTVLNNSV